MTTFQYPDRYQELIDQLRELQESPNSPLTDSIQNLHQLFRYKNPLEIIDDCPITNASPILDRLPLISDGEATLPRIEEFLQRFAELICGEYGVRTEGERAHWSTLFATVRECGARLVLYEFICENDEMVRLIDQWRIGPLTANSGNDFEEDSCAEVESEFGEYSGERWVDPEVGQEEMFLSRRTGYSEDTELEGEEDDGFSMNLQIRAAFRERFAESDAFESDDDDSEDDDDLEDDDSENEGW